MSDSMTRRDALLGLGATTLTAALWPLDALAKPPHRPPHPIVFVRRSLSTLGGLDPATFEFHQVRWNVEQLIRVGQASAEHVLDRFFQTHKTAPDAVIAMLRGLYEVPTKAHPKPGMQNVARAGHLRPPALGAPSPAPPKDLRHTPHYPVLWLGDLPLSLVQGYALAGKAEPASMHYEALKKDGVFRTKPHPTVRSRADAEARLAKIAPHLSAHHKKLIAAQLDRVFKP